MPGLGVARHINPGRISAQLFLSLQNSYGIGGSSIVMFGSANTGQVQ